MYKRQDDAIETLLMNAIHGGKLATFLPKMHLSNDDITFIPVSYTHLLPCGSYIETSALTMTFIPSFNKIEQRLAYEENITQLIFCLLYTSRCV